MTDGVTETYLEYCVAGRDNIEAEADSETSIEAEPGTSAEMKVQAVSESGILTYEWHKSWNDRNGGCHSVKVNGANTDTYIAEDIQESCTYRCNVSSTADSSDIYFNIQISAPVTITSPVDSTEERTVQYGGSTELAVTVAEPDYGPLSYQWYWYDNEHNATAIQGATEATYTAESILHQTVYFCTVTNAYGKTADCSFRILIEGDYKAFPWEYDVTAELGGSCELRVSIYAPGDVLTYQWYGPVTDKRDEPQIIPGETGDAYILENASTAGYYLCKVVNEAGIEKDVWFHTGIASDLAIEPAYDAAYGSAEEETVISVNASSSAGEVAYQWYVEDNEQYGFEYAHMIEGATSNTFIITNPVKNYTNYYCVVSDIYGNTRTAQREVYISGELYAEGIGDYAQYIRAGESATFAVSASGSGSITYQWWKAGILENGDWGEFQVIEGATGDTCTVENVRARTQGFFMPGHG